MMNGKERRTGLLGSYANRDPRFAAVYDKLNSLRQELPEETASTLSYRENKGYKPVTVPEKEIEVGSEEEFNQMKRFMNSIPNDPSRNRIISELGYRPVLRFKQKTTNMVEQPTKVVNPKTSYELSFTTMPDKKLTLQNQQEYDEARMISDIDSNLANEFQRRFSPKGLDRNNAYQSYSEASKNPANYSKMYLNEQDRNNIIANYAKEKGLNPQDVVNTYVSKRNKYYPRELVGGQGNLEVKGDSAANTLYGYRNYLTTMIPSAITTNEESTVMKQVPVEEVKEMSYPFKFGYKNSGSRSSSNGSPSKPSIDDSDCEGGICEMSAERMARKNKFLFKKKYGGKISQEDVNKFKEKFGY